MYKEKFNLAGKKIIITGANGILGRHQVTALLEMGARVFMTDVNPGGIDEFRTSLTADERARVSFDVLDITREAAIAEYYEKLDAKGISANVLINNAAAKSENFFEPFDNYHLEDWNQVMNVNVTGAFLMSKYALQRMMKLREGLIINFSSIYGINGPDARIYEGSFYMGREINTPPVYATSKAATIGLSKYIATTYGKYNIRSNVITPGGIFSGQNDTFVGKYSARVPLGRMGEPEDIASAVTFLCSDAARYLNGHNLVVDGGLNAW